MNYCDYDVKQVFDSCNNYDKLCNIFLKSAPDKETKDKLVSILYEGHCDGFYFCSGETNKNNPNIEGLRRISMADLLLRNPETFDFMVSNKVCLFHGTNGNALPSILKHGLTSARESKNRGIEVNTGEEWSRIGSDRNFISFADVLDYAEAYSSLSPNGKGNDALSFPVIVGTTVDDLLDAGKYDVFSGISEVGVKGCLPLENIRMIGVPSDKVSYVSKLIGDGSHIEVLPVDGIEKKIYYMDVFDNHVEIVNSRLDSNKEDKKFTVGDVKEVLSNFKLSQIRERLWDGKVKPFEMESYHDIELKKESRLAKVREKLWNFGPVDSNVSEVNLMLDDTSNMYEGESYGKKNH